MGRRTARSRIILAVLACLCFFSAACGGTSTNTTVAGPTISRCGVTVSGVGAPVPFAGGTGTLTVSTERECAWSARAESSWISLTSAEGQGPATLTYSVQPNAAGTERRGAVAVGESRVEIVQQAAPCRYAVEPGTREVAAAGGTVEVVLAAPAGCPWTAQRSDSWIAVDPETGSGAATIRVVLSPNPGPPRTATVTVAGSTVSLRQAAGAPPDEPCRYAIAPAGRSSPAAGETVAVTVSAAAGCAWTAASDASWISVLDNAAGSGSGTVRLQIHANGEAPRTGTVRIAGLALTIEQEGKTATPCSYGIEPASRSVSAQSQDVTVDVRTGADCAWNASSSASWLSIASGGSGSGNGSVRLTVAANTGAARTGSALIAGRVFTVTQAAAPVTCTYSLKPTYYNAGRGSDDVQISVSTSAECQWTASSPVNWATIANGRSGTGSGTVRVQVSANAGDQRQATLTIAGQAFALAQEGSDCEATLKPTYYNAGPGPDDFEIEVKTKGRCAWTATSPVAWATVVEGASGTGNDDVRIRVEPNPGPARSAKLSIAGVEFTLTQEARR
jgi:hypothetical protein